MKKIMLILVTVLSMAILNCKKTSPKEFAEKFGMQTCYKIADCAQEKMKSLTEEQKKLAGGFMFDRNKCDEEIKKEKERNKDEVLDLTADDIAVGEKCLEEMKKMSCDDMQKPSDNCKTFGERMEAKSKDKMGK